MKTEQEQTKQMLKTLCDKFQCSAIDRSYMAKSCRQCEDIIEALHEAGYGDISEYKAEIERLKEKNNELNKERWSLEEELKKKELEITYARNNGYEKGYDECEEYTKGKIEQAKINILGKLKERIETAINTYFNLDGGGYYLAEDVIDDIDDLIKEIDV